MKALAAVCLVVLFTEKPAPDFAEALRAYADGRYDAAWSGFAALLEGAGEHASRELRIDAALAALRLGRTADAAAALGPLLAADPSPELAFVAGLAALQRAERAAAAAALADAEPLAWTMAQSSAADSVRWFAAADTRGGGWPMALRNAERAARRLAEFATQRDQHQQRREAAPEPPPPPPAGRGDEATPAVPELPGAALGEADLQRLLRLLQQREVQKQHQRQASRRAEAVPGEHDW
ncbi:MAG: hypothetical protein IT455_10030 [Planctomycetes bacterium]|nr:hypothetical protein [Planctomycetota bacterium]